jgi:hypothetical protein
MYNVPRDTPSYYRGTVITTHVTNVPRVAENARFGTFCTPPGDYSTGR